MVNKGKTSNKDAIKGIIEKRPDAALIDLGLPDISGAVSHLISYALYA